MVKKLVWLIFIISLICVTFAHGINFLLPIKYEKEIKEAALINNLEEELVYAIIKTESDFNEEAESSKGAKGLMQITQETYLWCAEKMGLENKDTLSLTDPEVNIKVGCWYLSYLYSQTNSMDLAIIAYNAGINRVREWQQSGLVDEKIEDDNNIPFKETKNYIKKVKYYTKLYEYRLDK